jgi:hypothetical protein
MRASTSALAPKPAMPSYFASLPGNLLSPLCRIPVKAGPFCSHGRTLDRPRTLSCLAKLFLFPLS